MTDIREVDRVARERINAYLATLPAAEDNIFQKETLAAQKYVLEKLHSPEDREALYRFLVEFTTYIIDHVLPNTYEMKRKEIQIIGEIPAPPVVYESKMSFTEEEILNLHESLEQEKKSLTIEQIEALSKLQNKN